MDGLAVARRTSDLWLGLQAASYCCPHTTPLLLPLALRRQRGTHVGLDLCHISGTDRTIRVHVFAEI